MVDMRPIFKMAANSPRWPPKKCQTIFLQNIQPISEKNRVWQESTKKFHDIRKDDTTAYTTNGSVHKTPEKSCDVSSKNAG